MGGSAATLDAMPLARIARSSTVALAPAAALAGPAAGAQSAPADGRIAFVSERDGNAKVYVMGADGEAQMRLTRTPAGESEPARAPDGTHLAVARGAKLHVVRAEGAGAAVQLTDGGYCYDGDPTWSPDGRQLAFTRVPGHLSVTIATMTTDGRRHRFLAGGRNGHPDWSPDGREIAFTAAHVASVAPPGTSGGVGRDQDRPSRRFGGTRSDARRGVRPAWSPDGTRIAFQAERDGNVDVYVMDADGGNVARLTADPAPDSEPTWSPDGTRIAFVSRRSGNADVYVMAANGEGETRLTDSSADDVTPDWGPPPSLSPIVLPARPAAGPLSCRAEQERRVSLSLRGHLRALGKVSTRGPGIVRLAPSRASAAADGRRLEDGGQDDDGGCRALSRPVARPTGPLPAPSPHAQSDARRSSHPSASAPRPQPRVTGTSRRRRVSTGVGQGPRLRPAGGEAEQV